MTEEINEIPPAIPQGSEGILLPEQMAENASIRAAMAEQARPQIENSLLHQITLNQTLVKRTEALEDDLHRTRDLLERERKVNKAIKRTKGKSKILKKNPEPWHELVTAFDTKRITALPIPGRIFLQGFIDDVIVVSVPEDSTPEEIAGFKKGLHGLGMTSAAVIVKEGTRFLKLVPVDAGQRAAIEAKMEEIRGQEEATPASEAEDGPEGGDGEATPAD